MQISQLFLSRNKQDILKDINLKLPSPGLIVLLGANGAGKSSLLKVLAGISQMDSGSIETAAKIQSFMMPEPAAFYPHLTVKQQLAFVQNISSHNNSGPDITAVLNHWQLNDVANKPTKHLSLGYRQRLSLAQLMISTADVLLLDEPMNGMDQILLAAFKTQLRQWQKTKTIIMATHILHEAQDLAEWVVVMERGQVIHSAQHHQATTFVETYQRAIQAYRASQADCVNAEVSV